MVKTAKEGIKQQDSNSKIYGKMQAVFIEMDKSPATNSAMKELKDLKEAVIGSGGEDAKDAFDPKKHIDAYLPVRLTSRG
ncbi:boron transporter 4-like [Magnolia sinica]|uniref:boron transporter 4-like n=1 Tax=Magnolia sinica TaxID=86752 RepID=UPI00265AC372|nr:boron transporter 4-like [Magnolia sinica]